MSIKKIIQLKNTLDSSSFHLGWVERQLHRSMVRKGYISTGWNERSPEDIKILNSVVFTKAALPFCSPFYDSSKSKPMLVPSEDVLGGKYFNLHKSLSEAEAIRKMNVLDSYAISNDPEAAHYTQIGKFSLYVPSEGKNRVSLYRKYRRSISALVSQSDYPSNTQLALIKIRPFGLTALQYLGKGIDIRFIDFLIVSSNPLTVLLPFEESVQFFESYNVTYGKSMFWLKAPLVKKMAEIYVMHRLYIK